MANSTVGQYTIQDYIDTYRDLVISYDTLHLFEAAKFTPDASGADVGVIISDVVTSKYKKDLDEIVTTKKLTNEEQKKYKYNPWLLSYDLYNTTEYWFLLLELNHLYSAIEFTLDTVKVYGASLPRLIDAIMAKEKPFINSNESQVNEELNKLLNE